MACAAVVTAVAGVDDDVDTPQRLFSAASRITVPRCGARWKLLSLVRKDAVLKSPHAALQPAP